MLRSSAASSNCATRAQLSRGGESARASASNRLSCASTPGQNSARSAPDLVDLAQHSSTPPRFRPEPPHARSCVSEHAEPRTPWMWGRLRRLSIQCRSPGDACGRPEARSTRGLSPSEGPKVWTSTLLRLSRTDIAEADARGPQGGASLGETRGSSTKSAVELPRALSKLPCVSSKRARCG